MSETETVEFGAALPRIGNLKVLDGRKVEVAWTRPLHGREVTRLDLGPTLHTYKFYRPLREDRAMFETAHVIDEGAAIAWGDDEALDMAATTLASLVDEVMEPADFAAFLKRCSFTYDRAAIELGISRRLVAYYASEREVPRYIALACKYLESHATSGVDPRFADAHRPRLSAT